MTKTATHNWTRLDALTDAQVHAATLADPDAQPLTNTTLAPSNRVPAPKPRAAHST